MISSCSTTGPRHPSFASRKPGSHNLTAAMVTRRFTWHALSNKAAASSRWSPPVSRYKHKPRGNILCMFSCLSVDGQCCTLSTSTSHPTYPTTTPPGWRLWRSWTGYQRQTPYCCSATLMHTLHCHRGILAPFMDVQRRPYLQPAVPEASSFWQAYRTANL